MSIPTDRKYTKSHEWIKLQGDVAIVGITDHAQGELGDITFVELPEVGESVSQGKSFAEIESVKAASEIYAPVSGTVIAANDALEDEPETVNASPFDRGWIVKIKDFDSAELDALLDADAYTRLMEAE